RGCGRGAGGGGCRGGTRRHGPPRTRPPARPCPGRPAVPAPARPGPPSAGPPPGRSAAPAPPSAGRLPRRAPDRARCPACSRGQRWRSWRADRLRLGLLGSDEVDLGGRLEADLVRPAVDVDAVAVEDPVVVVDD